MLKVDKHTDTRTHMSTFLNAAHDHYTVDADFATLHSPAVDN